MGVKALQRVHMGDESTAGTAVASTAVWRGMGNIKDNRVVEIAPERIGIAMPTTRNYIPKLEAGLQLLQVPATFEQLPYVLEGGISVETPTQDGAGSGYIYAYAVGTSSVNTIQTYTFKTGDNTQAYRMAYGFCESFSLSAEAGASLMVESNWIGRQFEDTTFDSPSIPTVEEILGGKGTLYIDANSGTMGSTAKSGLLLNWTLDVTTGWKAKYTVDDGQLYFNYAYYDADSFSATLSGVFEHNSDGLTEQDAFQAGTPRLFQIVVEGSALSSAGTTYSNKHFEVNAAGTYTEFSELSDQEGNSIVEFTAQIGYDPTSSEGLDFIVVNELTALP